VNDFREDTPAQIVTDILGLKGTVVDSPEALAKLRKAIRDKSRCEVSGTDGRLVMNLFASHHTGYSRTVQDFRCVRRGCPAFVRFDISSGKAVPHAYDFGHTHKVRDTAHRGLLSLSNEERDRLRKCAEQGMSSARIHMVMDFDVDPHALADAKRDVLTKKKWREVDELIHTIENWDDFTTQPLYDTSAGRCGGCYFFHKVLAGTTACTGVLVMDDTACTNHFGLPLVVIIGLDEHGRNQVVAFAFLFDRCTERFEHFLSWLRPQLGGVPRAFVVDRHEGQSNAIQSIFPESQLVYCAKHLAANIAQWFAKKSKIVKRFWALIKCKITRATWVEFLADLDAHLDDNTSRKRMVRWLLDNLDHYCPDVTFVFTSQQVSSRVEGFFGTLKTRIEHGRVTLTELACAVRGLARAAFAKRLLPRAKPICGADILALPLQFRLGRGAATTLRKEVAQLRGWNWLQDTFDRDAAGVSCCAVASRFRLPCLHLMLRRIQERSEIDTSPLLTLEDFPPQVILPASFDVGPPATHETAEIDIAASMRAHGRRWTRNRLLAILDPVIDDACAGGKHAESCIHDLLRSYYHGAPPVEGGPLMADPLRQVAPGRRQEHPARSSPLNPARPPPPRQRAQEADGPKRVCTVCHGRLHPGNRRSCPIVRMRALGLQ
jgi:hypothetical protein